MAAIEEHIQQACLDIWQNKFARLATTARVVEEIQCR
jgi:hypothetical protein